MENNRVVIDTNVFISAIIGQSSYPYKIFSDIVFTGEAVICLSPEPFNEFTEVAQRPKFHKIQGFLPRASKLFAVLKEIAYWSEPDQRFTVISDEPDNRLLELAVSVNAYAIVTGNTNDFSFSDFQGIKILTPKEYFEAFLSQ